MGDVAYRRCNITDFSSCFPAFSEKNGDTIHQYRGKIDSS